jgi:hypothetical protein
MKRALALLAILMLSHLVAAYDNAVESALSRDYRNKVLTLRHPVQANVQEYDAQGKLLTQAKDGPWTLYARLRITKITMENHDLQIEGVRVATRYDIYEQRLIDISKIEKETQDLVPAGASVQLRIKDAPDSVERLNDIMGNIFAFTVDDFVSSVPEFWRYYITRYVEAKKGGRGEFSFNARAVGSSSFVPQQTMRSDPVYKVDDKGVVPPKPKSTPTTDDWQNKARRIKFRGECRFWVIADKSGSIEVIQVIEPLGWGLDEAAAQNLRTWRFEPAKLKGEAVSVAFTVNMNFDLY